mgnify:FL=1|tara:strand:- start:166 stop:600 length:435 start_codon:yes stop_codon:yes gene_type:complete
MNKLLPNSYYKSPNYYKGKMIAKWKGRGVIYHDFDELYEVYINTNNCSHCLKEFKTSQERKLDHCHESGKFRAIVCNACNIGDSYLKYPPHFSAKDKKKQHKQSTEYKNKRNQKGNCFFCDKNMIIRSLRRHYLEGRCVIKPIT